MIQRRKTRKVMVGDAAHGFVAIGGDAPVSVQTMTAGYTHEIDKCVAEIHKLAAAGADIVRVAVPEKKDTAALKEILPQVTVPIVADVHFHFQRALEAIEAGVHKIRLNPGNITDRGAGEGCHPGLQGEENSRSASASMKARSSSARTSRSA